MAENGSIILAMKIQIEGCLHTYLDDVYHHNLSDRIRLYILKRQQNFISASLLQYGLFSEPLHVDYIRPLNSQGATVRLTVSAVISRSHGGGLISPGLLSVSTKNLPILTRQEV